MATILEEGLQQDNNTGQEQKPQDSSIKIRTQTGDGRLYIIPERELENRIEIQFVIPELSWNRSASIQTINIVGRNNPLYQYTGGETSMSLQLDFYAQAEDRKDVITKCRYIESLAANNGYKNPPQRIRLVYGKLFRDEMWVIKSVKYKLSNFDKQYDFMPKQAYVDIDLALDTRNNLTTEDIRRV